MDRLSRVTEADLIARTLLGDTDAFAVLVSSYQAAVIRVAQRLVGEKQEAEDVAQETFIRAHKALPTFDRSRPLGPWLYRIATNLSFNRLKRRRSTVALLGDDNEPLPLPDAAPGPEGYLLRSEAQARLRREVTALPDHYRRVIELRHFSDLSYQEIAEELDVPVSDVKSWLFRARKRLRHRLMEDGG
jgi:RNA polymerase sigma-70 factor (ECF subfamily)